MFSPALSNECLMLELSRAWDPSDSSRPLPVGKGEETPFGFSYGNQND
jgi:hypothetical protein